jgi:hypothetical protein
VVAVALAPDGDTVMSIHRGPDGFLARLHRVRGGRPIAELPIGSIELFAFGPAGELLALANGAEVVLVDLEGGRTLASHELEAPVAGVAVTPDGQAIIARTATSLRVLEKDGAARAAVPELAKPWAISADGEKLAVCEAGTLLVRDLLTRQERTLGDCTLGDDVSFSPRGTYVASRRGSYVEIFRAADGAGLGLHAPRLDENLDRRTHAYAVATNGRYELDAEASADRFLYRRSGPLQEAALVSLDQAPATPGLVAGFFGAPADPEEEPPAED